MKIYLATDHAGFDLKEKIKKFLTDAGYRTEDCGAFKYDENDDYPDFIKKAAEAVSECGKGNHSHPERSEDLPTGRQVSGDSSATPLNDSGCRAIIFGGSGQGEAMVANRYKGVRAAVVYDFNKDIIKLSREHNDANILSLGAMFLKEKDALKAVELWLKTNFSGEERHRRRLEKF